MAGEGYGGNFIPYFAKSIINSNSKFSQQIVGNVNLKGILINDPYSGFDNDMEEALMI